MKFVNKAYSSVIFISLAMTIFILLLVGISNSSNTESKQGTPLQINGSYSIDGAEEKPLTDIHVFDDMKKHRVVIRGNFTENIDKNQIVAMHMCNLKVAMSVNGEQVYSFGYDKLMFTQSPGITWNYYTSQGITPQDEIQLTLENAYSGMGTPAFGDFLSDLQVNNGIDLLNSLIKIDGVLMILGAVILVLGAALFIYGLMSRIFSQKIAVKMEPLGFFIFFGGLWIVIDGGYDLLPLLFNMPSVISLIDTLCVYLFFIGIAALLSTYMSGRTRTISRIWCLIFCAMLIAGVFLQITGLCDLAQMQIYLIGVSIISVVMVIVIYVYEFVVIKKKQNITVMLMLMPIIICNIAEITNYFFDFMPYRFLEKIGITITCVLLLSKVIMSLKKLSEIERKMKTIEDDLVDSRTAMMLSQIQPHFIYNTLNTIRYFCKTDPDKADNLIERFATYLRTNMDSVNFKTTVPFEQELKHVKDYVYIETVRFGNINVIYNIGVKNFLLPVLTVQPLVENAIKYGVTQRESGGTVTVSTYEDASGFYVRIDDDGVGFDVNAVKKDGRSHIGIQNTTERVSVISAGIVSIKSKVGVGTTALITIPK